MKLFDFEKLTHRSFQWFKFREAYEINVFLLTIHTNYIVPAFDEKYTMLQWVNNWINTTN